MINQNFWPIFFSNLTFGLDEIQSVAKTYWFVEAHVNLFCTIVA